MPGKQQHTIFLRLFLPLVVLVTGFAFLYGQAEIERELSRLKSQETLSIGLGNGALSRNLQGLTNDLVFLATLRATRAVVNEPTPQNIRHLEEDFSNFSRSMAIYDQLRWIDETGMEIVRVDYVFGKATVIPANQLQNKGQRYFFTDTFKLNPGEIFISPLDLNVEQDRIEIPYKPMLRLATPVTDQNGVKRGIVIMNYFGRVMLDSFAAQTGNIIDHAMLLNSEGYWLKSSKTSDEWGFMFKRSDLTLAKAAPLAWAEIISADSGQKTMPDGLWTWQTVYPLHAGQDLHTSTTEAFARSRGEVESNRYFWKSVAHVPADFLSTVYQTIWLKITLVSALLLSLLAFISWKLTTAWSKHAVAEDEVRQLNFGLEQLVAERTQELQSKVTELDTEIFERKAAQEELQLAAGVFTHALEGIMITTPDATIIDVNDAFTRITGYSREDAIGQNPRILNSGRQGPDYFVAMWHSLINDGYWFGEVWNRRKNGELFVEMQTVSAVRDAQGKVSQYISLFSDITDRKEHESQLEHIAHFDALTNLPNRVLLADRLQQATAQAQRRGQRLAVAYLDLDGFKAINDQHGHATGDQMLISLAKRMKEALREGDTLARMGGDEFVAVLIDLADTSASVPLLDRMLSAAALPVQVGDLMLQVSASLGVTFYPQAHDIEPDQLLRQADQAMYQAKLAGKNRYQIFDAAQDSNLRVYHESLERIRLALGLSEFVLHYQPKVNMHSGIVIGAEALIRWQHPDRGLLAPASFLPVIEDHPLAVDVGEWVIDAALTQIERWHATGLDLPVSVNIGARQLQQGDFVRRLQAILARHPQVNPTSLELEVLETSALSDMAQVSQVIEDCARIGVKFALDDFGTGYSSLTYLKRLRVALLKIDQSFVRDMLDDPDDLAILQGVIGLAAAFKREVIAEGVETVAHGTALLKLGCELAQGYGIARPMPPEQMPAWAATWQPDAAWCTVPWRGDIE